MKKIMFSDRYGLTDAVLRRLKTMTRRMVVVPKELQEVEHLEIRMSKDKTCAYICTSFDKAGRWKSPVTRIKIPYTIGEEIAIAQCYEEARKAFAENQQFYLGYYTDVENAHQKLWEDIQGVHNKMFVRADLMPHRIRITGIKVERLQEISEEDCLREGIKKMEEGVPYRFDDNEKIYLSADPRMLFASLINKVSGKGTWESNPWVFAYEFELIK